MLSSQINNNNNKIIKKLKINSAVIYAGFNMHIFWPKGQIIIPNRHKIHCTSSSKATMHWPMELILVSWESLGSV
jgi:hypothetical protein